MTKSLASVPKLSGGSLFGHGQEFRADPVGLLLRAARDHGDAVRVRLGFFEALVLNTPALAQELLIEQQPAFMKSPGISLFARPLLGNGLLTSEGDVHRRQRRLIAPAFVQKRVASYAATMVERAERGLARMLQRGTIELSEETMQTTLEIVAKTLFNAEVGQFATEVGEAVTDAMQAIIQAFKADLPLPPPLPTPSNLRQRRAVARLDKVLYPLIEERKRSAEDHGDMLSLLLAARDEENQAGMSDTQVRDEAMTAFLAGHETTANALAWTLYLLAKNPDERARVELELDTVLAGRAPRYDDLPQLPATLRAFKEAMRLYPPAFFIGRRALHDVQLGAVAVRKGTILIANVYGIHHADKYFLEPERFDPARFSRDREAALARCTYMPFGAGARMCIGNAFALMEGHLLLATWLSGARFSLLDPEERATLEPLITLRPKAPLRMRVEARAKAAQVAQ